MGIGSCSSDDNTQSEESHDNAPDSKFFDLKAKLENVFGENLGGKKLNGSFEFNGHIFSLTVWVSSYSLVLQIAGGNPVIEISSNGRANFQKVSDKLNSVFHRAGCFDILDSIIESLHMENNSKEEMMDSIRALIQLYL